MEVQTVIESVVKLPPTPQILPKLQKLLRDENSGIHDIISLLKVDAPMTAQIVRISNSAFYAAGDSSQSLEDAINRLGFNEVYKVVSMAAAKQVMGDSSSVYKLEKGDLLDHSIACAIMMVEGSASCLREDLDSMYTIGLLHAIGKVVITQFYMKHGLEIYDPEADQTLDLEMEKQLLGFDHTEAGAELLKKWNFGPDVFCPILNQFRADKVDDYQGVTAMLALSRFCIPYVKDHDSANMPDISTCEELLNLLSLSEDDLMDCILRSKQGFLEIKQMIS